MRDINNFENLMYVTAKSFEQLKEKLASIAIPAKILTIEEKQIGTFYAILAADRKVKGRPPKSEV